MKKFKNILLATFALIGLFTFLSHTKRKDSKPNVVVLVADDLRHDMLGAAGNPIIQTPHIDRLARNGVFFSRGYVTTSICPVSRASILSGQHGRRHGIWGFHENFSPEAMDNIYPMRLKDSGYTIGFIGKWGIGPTNEIRDKFDYWRGFDAQGTYNHQDSNGNYMHLTSLIGDQMRAFIEQQERKQPFNLSVSFKAPHVEKGVGDPESSFVNDPVYDTLYTGQNWPMLPTADSAFYQHFSNEFLANNEAIRRFNARFGSTTYHNESIARYYRLVHGIDIQVGRLVQALRDKKLLKNTIIIFTSDNGFYLGEYGFAGKWYGSEVSSRVPIIISGQKIKSKKIDQIVLNIDIAPTVLDYAQTEIPISMQGRSIKPLLESASTRWRTEFFYEHLWPGSSRTIIPSTRGIIQNEYKYMRYFNQDRPDSLFFEEMYDLTKDPFEEINLVQKREFRDFRDTMHQKIVHYMQALN